MKPTLIAPRNTLKLTLPIFVCLLEGTYDIVTHGITSLNTFKLTKPTVIGNKHTAIATVKEENSHKLRR
jgi:hypothetical protein